MLDLYACLRPAKYYPGVRSRYDNVDLVIVRENTEDLYAGVEFERGDPAIAQVSRITEAAGMGPIREEARLTLKIISEDGGEDGAVLLGGADAGLLDVPVELDAGSFEDADCGFGDLGAGAVAGYEGDAMGHAVFFSLGRGWPRL